MKILLLLKRFTLVEMLFVIAIIGILAGILLPSVMKSRDRAKSVRWLGFNEHWNRDGDTVLNFNFEYNNYTVKYGGTVFPGIRNGAIGCNIPGFEPPLYDGILIGSPEFKKRCGRWGNNNALQFDGVNDFVLILGKEALNFDPAKDDFTFVVWFNADNLGSGTKTFLSKADLPSGSQYEVSLDSKKITVGLGSSSTSADYADLQAGRWTNLVVRCSSGKAAIFVNGTLIGGNASASSGVSFDTSMLAMTKLPLELFSIAQSSKANSNSSNANSNASNAGGNSGNSNAGGNSGNSNAGGNSSNAGGNSGNSNAGGNSSNAGGNSGGTTVSSMSGGKFTIGAYGISGESDITGTTIKVQNTSYYFQGMIDEVIVIKRALSNNEIAGIYKMGNPY